MTSIIEAMATREKGHYPISIGTSLALESAFGHYPERPPVNPPPITGVRNLWINIRTLVRNYVGSMEATARERVRADDLLIGLQEEMSILESVIASGTQGMCSVVFYVCDYSRITSTFSNAWFKVANTAKQKAAVSLENAVVKGVLNTPLSQDVRKFNYELVATGSHPESFLISHYPIDLLSRKYFDGLTLLESHTGAIKHPGLWGSKLHTVKDATNIPFNRFTLQLFGDNVLFIPGPGHLRELILKLAKMDGWTNVTTMEKIRWTIGHVPNDIERGALLSLM